MFILYYLDATATLKAINANGAGDIGFIVIPPIAAMVFGAIGKNPLTGMLAAYAAVAGGFSANMVVNSLDVLVVGFTQAAVDLLDKSVIVNPASNWYFLMICQRANSLKVARAKVSTPIDSTESSMSNLGW